MLKEKIAAHKPGILTYAITPPKLDHPAEKILEITRKHIERIKPLDIDGLIIYDIQDEMDRQMEERPFPYLETIDSATYSAEYLKELNVPKVVYRCVGKYTEEQLAGWLQSDLEHDQFSVFVGASSGKQAVNLKLPEAYNIAANQAGRLTLGGVVIPERHIKNGDEHLRLISKERNGCSFFVSQVIYNVEASKNFLSDYYYYCCSHGVEMKPILFTVSPCGSGKTLEFMKWLGINVPRWMENDLTHSADILDQSINLSKRIFEELLDFALEKGIPIGCNVESVSVRKVEIEASVELTKDIRAMMEKKFKQ